MRECRAYGVKTMSHPQAKICGNDILPPAGVNANEVGFCNVGVAVSVVSEISTFLKAIDRMI